MDKEALFDLYYKISFLRECEKLISRSYLEKHISKLPLSYFNLEALCVALVSITDKGDYFFSTDRVQPYYILRHSRLEKGVINYFKILKNSGNITDNNLRTFFFEETPNRVFNIMGGMATSLKETGYMPAFIVTADSKRVMQGELLESILFSMTHALPTVYVIEKTKDSHNFSILDNIISSHEKQILRLEASASDVFSLRSVLQKATRNAREYMMPSIVICDAVNSKDCLMELSTKIENMKLPLDDIKERLKEDLNYLVNENLKDFLNVA